MKCRSCNGVDALPVLDFGSLPPANSYPEKGTDPETEPRYPLRVFVCRSCWLMQTEDKVDRKLLFNDSYAYHSSHSSSLLKHSADYASKMIRDLGLTSEDLVVEVASNDGYLLQYFEREGIQTLGIEPTEASADIARERGLKTIKEFFGLNLASELKSRGIAPRLMIGNNVLAHVPDINDFVSGFAEMLHPEGMATFEFPHVLNLLKNGLFDTIYHEHFSYLSAHNVIDIFAKKGMKVVEIEKISTHGGSLRIFTALESSPIQIGISVSRLLTEEKQFGLQRESGYASLSKSASKTSNTLRSLLTSKKEQGVRVYGFGAAAKSSTLLNYAAVDSSLIEGVFDSNPAKNDLQIPGTGIPILEIEAIRKINPEYLVVFPWNLIDEVAMLLETRFSLESELLIPRVLEREHLLDLQEKNKNALIGSLPDLLD